MCLATVYKTEKETESVVLKNVSKIRVDGNQVHLFDIMGMEEIVEGVISMADLTGGVVKIECPA
ncbi:MAG: CooT family nickel-binding protein [Lachnospiraceae bacterium]|jgi:predicted RNA-binding protein|nr:CooT family nickel-binding protein [Lachnospiraceae bacterium]MCI8994870.1 CooT family nickel-binding protein [Lachnospiraceae bacterium]MCI9135619.1 CooT family nickel-binding protein [Lachnospiraceae bacterium]